MTSKEIIELAIAGWEYEEARKPENQKLFPFYIFTNFHVKSFDGETYPDLICDYCGENISEDNNGSYYTSYVVFESADVVKAICNVRHCEKKPKNLMEYRDQIYGFREPVTLPEKFKSIKEYEAVFEMCLRHSNGYWARQFPNGITIDEYKENIRTELHGFGCSEYSIEHDFKGIRYWGSDRIGTKPKFTLNDKKIVQIINSIIKANYGCQNELFD